MIATVGPGTTGGTTGGFGLVTGGGVTGTCGLTTGFVLALIVNVRGPLAPRLPRASSWLRPGGVGARAAARATRFTAQVPLRERRAVRTPLRPARGALAPT